jgi:hypothetical protein
MGNPPQSPLRYLGKRNYGYQLAVNIQGELSIVGIKCMGMVTKMKALEITTSQGGMGTNSSLHDLVFNSSVRGGS